MRRELVIPFLLIACGGSSTSTPPPPTTPPTPTTTVPVASAAPIASSAPTPSDAPPFAVLPMIQSPSCIVRGSERVIAQEIVFKHHGKPFARIPAAEWIELHLGANGTATVAARTKRVELAGEIDLGAIVAAPATRLVKDGWITVDAFKFRQVSANGDISAFATLPRIMANALPVEVSQRCAEVTLNASPGMSSPPPMRLFKRPSTTTLRDAPNGKVIASLVIPAKATERTAAIEPLPYVARVLEQQGKDAKVSIWDRGTRVEGWIEQSALVPANDRDTQATLLAAEAEAALLGTGMLAVLGGTPQPETCARPMNVFVRDGGVVVGVGVIREGNALNPMTTKSPDQKPGEIPVDLGYGTGGLVPFILESSYAACRTRIDDAPVEVALTLAPNRGLVARNAVSASPTGVAVSGPKGDVQIGAVTMTPPINDGERVVAGLRARFRQCYQTGLGSDPQMAGKLSITSKVGPRGEIISATVGSNTGMTPAVANCVANVLKRAQFALPGPAGATITVPIMFALEKP